jgi:hypothetical protein
MGGFRAGALRDGKEAAWPLFDQKRHKNFCATRPVVVNRHGPGAIFFWRIPTVALGRVFVVLLAQDLFSSQIRGTMSA